jgi:tripartite-type tricarboxylate transporter receptor subunit TctC
MSKRIVVGLAAVLAVAAAPAAPQTVAEFFKDKQVTVYSAGGPGGPHGLYAQILGPSIQKNLPGNPSVIVQYMPGAGGTRAANFLYNAAPKDGTVMVSPLSGIAMTSRIGGSGVRYDAAKLNWIGGAEIAPITITVMKTAGVRSLEDAKAKEVVLSASGRGSDSYVVPIVANALFGTRFKVVTGYEGIAGIDQAVETDETQGRAATWASIKTVRKDWIAQDRIVHLAVVSPEPEPDLPGVPLLASFARTDDARATIDFIAANALFGRTWVAPPEVPADRIAALRDAYWKALNDPETAKTLAERNFDLRPVSWQRLTEAVERMHKTDEAVVARIREIMGVK